MQPPADWGMFRLMLSVSGHLRSAVYLTVATMLLHAGGCTSTAAPTSEQESAAAIQGAVQDGAADTIHGFAVAVLPANSSIPCTGVLLAPNLVVTARHCVAEVPSSQAKCDAAMFGDQLPASDVYVSTDSTIAPHGQRTAVQEIRVPPESRVCGNDIAALILSGPVDVQEYVVPTFFPPMNDASAYGTTFVAIGYGVEALDDGESAGTRRIKENVSLVCVADDSRFEGCERSEVHRRFDLQKEFLGGYGPCNGDSGSGAFEQRHFDSGDWVAFGVLSRVGVSPDGLSCTGSVYARFDAWQELLSSAAHTAARHGGYAAPAWAGSVEDSRGCSVGSEGPERNVLVLVLLGLAFRQRRPVRLARTSVATAGATRLRHLTG